MLMRTLMSVFLFIFSMSASATAGDTPKKKQTIGIGEDAIRKLPVLGEIDASLLTDQSVKVKDLFVGESAQGKIWLKNGFSVPLEIRGLSASCGCAKAFLPTKTVDSLSRTPVILNLKPTKKGDYSIAMRLKTSKGVLDFRIIGQVNSRIQVDVGAGEFTKKDDVFVLPVTVSDKSLVISQLVFWDGTKKLKFTFNSTGRGWLSIPVPKNQAKVALRLIPHAGEEELDPLYVSFSVPNRLNLETRTIVVRSGEFFLTFTGDVSSLKLGQAEIAIKQGNTILPLKYSVIASNRTLVIKCKFPKSLSVKESVTIQRESHVFNREVLEL